MPPRPTRTRAWLVRARMAAAGGLVAWREGLVHSLVAVGIFVGISGVALGVAYLGTRARRATVAALRPRLDLLERDGGRALWRDRETGQRRGSVAWDLELTEDEVFTLLPTEPE